MLRSALFVLLGLLVPLSSCASSGAAGEGDRLRVTLLDPSPAEDAR